MASCKVLTRTSDATVAIDSRNMTRAPSAKPPPHNWYRATVATNRNLTPALPFGSSPHDKPKHGSEM